MNNMKKKLVLFASVAIALASCQTTPLRKHVLYMLIPGVWR